MKYLVVVAAIAATVTFGCTPPSQPPSQLAHDFPALELQGYSELDWLCQSWTLNNDEPIYLNEVVMDAGPAWHHSNWFYVPEEMFAGDDDVTWDCDERSFDEYSAALSGGVLYAMSTQATHESQKFTDGAALIIPPHSKIVGDIHLLNLTGDDIKSTNIRFELRALQEYDVPLKPMSLVYKPLDIPPQSKSSFTGNCNMSERNGGPVDINVYYVLPHYHYLGTGMRITTTGEEGETEIFENVGKVGDPLGITLDPPLSISGATDLSFTCNYNNTTDNRVGWGIGDQEMCVYLAFTDDTYAWAGGVFDGNEVLGTNADGVVENTGPCDVFKL